MIQSYLKIAFRSLWKHKGFSFINIAGLTLGTACCLYILLYVADQYRYDRHHEHLDSLFRVVTDIGGRNEGRYETARLSPPIAPAMAQDFPEVEKWTRVVDPPDLSHHVFSWQNKSFYETKGYYVDSTFFQLFSYAWLEGHPAHALDKPYSVVLTKSVAERVFGRQSAVGQVIKINNRFGEHDFTVTGVVDAEARKSHIRANFYMTMNSGGIGEYVRESNHWAGNNFISGYIQLKPQADPRALEAKLPAFLEKHGDQQLRELGMNKTLHLEPVKDIHLFSSRKNQLDTTISARFLWILLTIAAFIQLIACINFMNLATAQSTTRAREVGIRKAIGAQRGALVGRFLGESVLMAAIAIFLAVPLVQLSLPCLNQLTGSGVTTAFSEHSGIWLMVCGLVLVTGLLAGSYPAFYLSAFQAVHVLKGNFQNRMSAARLRSGLVVFQFVISVGLVAGAIIVQEQLHYLRNKDLGFEKEQKIVVPFRTQASRAQLPAFKNELLQVAGVESVCGTRVYPGQFVTQDFGVYTEGKDMNSAQIMQLIQADADYLKTLGIPLLSGRGFTPADTLDQLIMNQQGLKTLGIPEASAPGTKIYSAWEGQINTFEIVGVMRDFNFRPLRDELTPLMLAYRPTASNFSAIVSVQTNDYARLLTDVETAWGKLLPGLPFEYEFLDQELQKQYAAEENLAHIVQAFTLVAILISCLGLFGLAAFAAEQRTKEIGIRKVLGATTANILGLLSKDFLRLVLIALLIAAPLAWTVMNKWLEDFAYRIHIEWWVFALTGGMALAVAFLTVSAQSVKAALAKPVQSLRSE